MSSNLRLQIVRWVICVVAVCSGISLVAVAQTIPSIDGVYNGSYKCAQGPTNLKLSLQTTPGGEVSALFTFYLPSGPKEGYTYSLHGLYDPRTARVSLMPVKWETNHPANFVMVGMNGTWDSNEFSGTITGSGCSTFQVERGVTDYTIAAAAGAAATRAAAPAPPQIKAPVAPPNPAQAKPATRPQPAAQKTQPAATPKAAATNKKDSDDDPEEDDPVFQRALAAIQARAAAGSTFVWKLNTKKDALTDEVSSEMTALVRLENSNDRVTATASCFENGIRLLFLVQDPTNASMPQFDWTTDQNATTSDNQFVGVRMRIDGGAVHVAHGYAEQRGNTFYNNWMGVLFYDPGLRDRVARDRNDSANTGFLPLDSFLAPFVRGQAEAAADDAVNTSAGPMSDLLNARSIRVELPLRSFDPLPVLDINPQDKTLHEYVAACDAKLRPSGTAPNRPATPAVK